MIITVTVRARHRDGTLQLLERFDVVDLEEGGEVDELIQITYEHRVNSSRTPSAP